MRKSPAEWQHRFSEHLSLHTASILLHSHNVATVRFGARNRPHQYSSPRKIRESNGGMLSCHWYMVHAQGPPRNFDCA